MQYIEVVVRHFDSFEKTLDINHAIPHGLLLHVFSICFWSVKLNINIYLPNYHTASFSKNVLFKNSKQKGVALNYLQCTIVGL